jgi:hypothetical protein
MTRTWHLLRPKAASTDLMKTDLSAVTERRKSARASTSHIGIVQFRYGPVK